MIFITLQRKILIIFLIMLSVIPVISQASIVSLAPSPLMLQPTPPNINEGWFITLAPLDVLDTRLILNISTSDTSTADWEALLAVSYNGGGSGAMILEVTDPKSGVIVTDFDSMNNLVNLVLTPEPLDLNLEFALSGTAADLIGNSLVITRTSQDGSTTSVTGRFVVPAPAAIWLFSSGLIGLISIARYKN